MILPLPSTTHRILCDPSPAHLVALEAAHGAVTSLCMVSREAEPVAEKYILAMCAARKCDTTDAIALPIRPAVWRVWDDARDSAVGLRGKFSLSDGTPMGCMDVCRAAALVSCSIASLVEPDDEHAAIIELWYRQECEKVKRSVSVDIGSVALSHPRSSLASLAENEVQWAGDPLPFRLALDQIRNNLLRK